MLGFILGAIVGYVQYVGLGHINMSEVFQSKDWQTIMTVFSIVLATSVIFGSFALIIYYFINKLGQILKSIKGDGSI